MTSNYIRFEPEQVRSAIASAIRRIQILGENTLINSNSINLNEKCGIDFEIHTNDFTTDEMYDEGMSILQNNLRFIVEILRDYNNRRLNYMRIEKKFLRCGDSLKIFSIAKSRTCIIMCSKSEDANSIIKAVEDIEIVSCNNYI